MKNERQNARVYQFDPARKKKLKSADYVSPEKKQLLCERKRARKDQRNFYIGVGALLLLVAVLTFFRLRL